MKNPSIATPTAPGVSRRGFLGSASKVVAGSALLGALPISRFAHGAGADDTLKLALIGCGGRGSGATGQALTTGACRLVAMADAFKDSLEASYNGLKQKFGDKVDVPADRRFVGLEAYQQAIAAADVVVLGAPPGFRPQHFEETVKQGKHAFLEKPVATDAPGIRRMLAAVEESKKKNLKVVVGLQRHYQPGYIEAAKRVHDGAIGRITALRCYWNDAGVWVNPREKVAQMLGRTPTEMEFQMKNWYYFTWLSGDHIVEQHVHNIDVCNWLMKDYPTRCQGMGGRQIRVAKEYGEIFDHHAVEFQYKDGTRMFSFCRHMPNCWSSVTEHAVGTTGSCELSNTQWIIRDDKGKIAWRFKSEVPVDPYQVEHDVLFDAIKNNKELNDAENGTRSTMSGIMGRLATYSGQQILLDDALESAVDLFPAKLAWDAPPKVLPDKDGFYPVPQPGKSNVI